MEIAYSEILHKQGLLGLAWLASVGGILIVELGKAIRLGNGRLAYPLFLSALFVFIESTTNPFINNPIGMSVLIVCIAGLKVLASPESGDVPLPKCKEAAFG
jgi:hypothetical protein